MVNFLEFGSFIIFAFPFLERIYLGSFIEGFAPLVSTSSILLPSSASKSTIFSFHFFGSLSFFCVDVTVCFLGEACTCIVFFYFSCVVVCFSFTMNYFGLGDLGVVGTASMDSTLDMVLGRQR